MSSKRKVKRKSCSSKIRHLTGQNANYAAALYRKEHGGRVAAYHCRWCGGWHIGHR